MKLTQKKVKMIHWKRNDKLGKIYVTCNRLFFFLTYKALLQIHQGKRLILKKKKIHRRNTNGFVLVKQCTN